MADLKKNFFLRDTNQVQLYGAQSARVDKKIPFRDNRDRHAQFVAKKLADCYAQSVSQKQAAAIRYKEGVYLEFSSLAEYDLVAKSLENIKKGIRLANIRTDEQTQITKATIYIPQGQEGYFYKKVNEYATEETKKGKPKNQDLIDSIENIQLALLESFWVGDLKNIPDENPAWCELWLRIDKLDDLEVVCASFLEYCVQANIEYKEGKITFPERAVFLVKANKLQLSTLIETSAYIAEFRRAPETTSVFYDMSSNEQAEWVEDLLSRTEFVDSNSFVCLLDTGVNFAHPLIHPAVKSDSHIQSVNANWGIQDVNSHGTEMAGLVIYKDLKEQLESRVAVLVAHSIESVKILPKSQKEETPVALYGNITAQAISLAEIENPLAQRVICMAVTAPVYSIADGKPSSWSAAIDNITSGANEDGAKRLFLVSAGNVYPAELIGVGYPNANINHCIENPGQAWNAITVGAVANEIQITNPRLNGYVPVADVGGLSPYSSTSVMWDNSWPVKPEIVLAGGNVAANKDEYTECDDLSLLTTHFEPLTRSFSTIWGTSAATAQAAWMAAQIYAQYPDAWAETVRGLLVHSASWTENMKKTFCVDHKKTGGIRTLLRTCGYGIPDLTKAVQCANNSVNLIIESDLQPFTKHKMNEMHIHELPWPKEVLRGLGAVPVTIRVTLSYFIEPGPGEVGWKDKYRYSSCGLRFDLINSNENLEDFQKRVNIKMRGEDKKDNGGGSSRKWYLGTNNRDVGSIHSDYCINTAADLCDANYIAIYPVIGWWRERSHLGKADEKIRYSLIVTVETPEIGTDLYTPIATQIANKTVVEIPG